MALTFKAKGGSGDFKSCPSGSHIAVCNLVSDLGIQPGSGMFPDPKHQVYIRFEIAAERVEYERDGKKINAPTVIGQKFTASMHEKANLRKQLEGWRGKKFSDEEAEAFDVSAILGKACMLSVIEKVSGDKVYSNIQSISALPRGITAQPAENKLLYYGDDNKTMFDELPEWLRKQITDQIRPKAEAATGVYAQSTAYDFGINADSDLGITDDDIPF